MVNIGLLGDISAGKTSILRLFVRYLKVGDIEKVKGGQKLTIVKTDFSGEATVPGGRKEDALNQKETNQKETIKEAGKEAVEEMSQGTWQEVTAKIVYGKDIPGGLTDFIKERYTPK